MYTSNSLFAREKRFRLFVSQNLRAPNQIETPSRSSLSLSLEARERERVPEDAQVRRPGSWAPCTVDPSAATSFISSAWTAGRSPPRTRGAFPRSANFVSRPASSPITNEAKTREFCGAPQGRTPRDQQNTGYHPRARSARYPSEDCQMTGPATRTRLVAPTSRRRRRRKAPALGQHGENRAHSCMCRDIVAVSTSQT